MIGYSKTHHCAICLGTFPSKYALNEHMVNHVDTKPQQLSCGVCNFHVTDTLALEAHQLQTGHREPQAYCVACSDVFITWAAYDQHRKFPSPCSDTFGSKHKAIPSPEPVVPGAPENGDYVQFDGPVNATGIKDPVEIVGPGNQITTESVDGGCCDTCMDSLESRAMFNRHFLGCRAGKHSWHESQTQIQPDSVDKPIPPPSFDYASLYVPGLAPSQAKMSVPSQGINQTPLQVCKLNGCRRQFNSEMALRNHQADKHGARCGKPNSVSQVKMSVPSQGINQTPLQTCKLNGCRRQFNSEIALRNHQADKNGVKYGKLSSVSEAKMSVPSRDVGQPPLQACELNECHKQFSSEMVPRNYQAETHGIRCGKLSFKGEQFSRMNEQIRRQLDDKGLLRGNEKHNKSKHQSSQGGGSTTVASMDRTVQSAVRKLATQNALKYNLPSANAAAPTANSNTSVKTVNKVQAPLRNMLNAKQTAQATSIAYQANKGVAQSVKSASKGPPTVPVSKKNSQVTKTAARNPQNASQITKTAPKTSQNKAQTGNTASQNAEGTVKSINARIKTQNKSHNPPQKKRKGVTSNDTTAKNILRGNNATERWHQMATSQQSTAPVRSVTSAYSTKASRYSAPSRTEAPKVHCNPGGPAEHLQADWLCGVIRRLLIQNDIKIMEDGTIFCGDVGFTRVGVKKQLTVVPMIEKLTHLPAKLQATEFLPQTKAFKADLEADYPVEDFAFSPERDLNHPKLAAVSLTCAKVQLADGRFEVVKIAAVEVLTGRILLNYLVCPTTQEQVKDWRTNVTGLEGYADLEGARQAGYRVLRGWSAARTALWKFVDGHTILLGHCLRSDLDALRITHGRGVDIVKCVEKAANGPLSKPQLSLESLFREFLGKHLERGASTGWDVLQDAFAVRDVVLWILKQGDELVKMARQKSLDYQRVLGL